jgi:hypothetical protein
MLKATAVVTCIGMVLAYEYRDAILNLIIKTDYALQWNGELLFYIFLSIYIFICFLFYFNRGQFTEAIYHILTVSTEPIEYKKSLRNSKRSKIFFYIFLLLFCISFIFFNDSLIVKMGTDDAMSLVQGKDLRFSGDPGRYELKLVMNESGVDFSNKSLVFFMIQDGIYYFVEKQGPDFSNDSDNYTSIYAVPSSKVKLARLTHVRS